MATSASVIVRKGKAYATTNALTDVGYWRIVEPIYAADLTVGSLSEALQRLHSAGSPRIPAPTKYEREHVLLRRDPLLRAAGVTSWKKLAQGGASYSVRWDDDGLTIYVDKLDRQGRWVTDPAKTKELPPGTEVREIARIILEDVESR